MEERRNCNSEIKDLIKKSKLPQYEIARLCGVAEWTLCRWLRYELSKDDERYKLIIKAIEAGSSNQA